MSKTILLASAAVVALVGLGATMEQARAAGEDYRYCVVVGGRDAYENCGYATLQQCLETVHGLGGSCRPNPRYRASSYYSDGAAGAPARRRAVR